MQSQPFPNTEQLHAIAERYGTPCYVYSLVKIAQQHAHLRQHLPEARIFYALKANSNATLLRHFASWGLGGEVITLGELHRARRAGMPLLIGGPGQDARMLAASTEREDVAFISLDSASQWQDWQQVHTSARFLIRLNPQLDPRTHPHLATGAASSKFGMPLAHVVRLAEQLGSRLAGFHVHAGSQIRDISIYEEILAQLGRLFDRFEQARVLNIGGGFAVPNFPLADFAHRLRQFSTSRALNVIIEPGRFLVSEAGVLLTTVLHRKESHHTHLICDASMATLLRPALYDAVHPIMPLREASGSETVEVEGCLCENSDRLGRARQLPVLYKGDVLAIGQAGAYGMGMASNYASALRPAEVMLYEDGSSQLVRAREGVEALWQQELNNPA